MSCGGNLTGLKLTAGAGLLRGAGLSVSPALTSNISSFTSAVPAVGSITDVISSASGNGAFSGVMGNLSSIGQDTIPGLGNGIPTSLQSTLGTNSLTSTLTSTGNSILGADNGVFSQHLSSAGAFVSGSNEFITSAMLDSSLDQGLPGLNSVDSIMTGSFSQVNKAFPSFGVDLANTGNILNMGDLNNLGNPMSLAKNLQSQAGGLSVLAGPLQARGVDPLAFGTLLSQNDVGSLLNSTVGETLGTGSLTSATVSAQGSLDRSLANYNTGGLNPANMGLGELVYDAMGDVKGGDLTTLQAQLGSNVPNLNSMQDMMDPSKILPNSYQSLTSTPIPTSGFNSNLLSKVYVE